MDFTRLIVWLVSAFAVCDGLIINRQRLRPVRRLSWGRRNQRTNLRYNVPQPRGRTGRKAPKVSHNLQIRNLPLAPGQAKVIHQTLIVRRRGPSKKQRGSQQQKNQGGHPNPRMMIRPTSMPAGAGGHGNNNGLATLKLPVINIDRNGQLIRSPLGAGRGGAGGSGGHRYPSPTPSNQFSHVYMPSSNPAPTGNPTLSSLVSQGGQHGGGGGGGGAGLGGASQGAAGKHMLKISHTGPDGKKRFVHLQLSEGQQVIYTSKGVKTTVRANRVTSPTILTEDFLESRIGPNGQEIEL